jgi:signal transduction histidine kinase
VTLPAALLVRRREPFLTLVAVVGLLGAVDVAALVAGAPWRGLVVTAWVLVLPWSLARWATPPQVAAGLGAMAVLYATSMVRAFPGAGDAVAGAVVFLAPAALGAVARARADARLRQLEGARAREREQLARELHDTVAHHVSAIAIQAQAGRTLAAGGDGAAAGRALEVIEESAARALVDLRTMVGALRRERADLTPAPGVADIGRLTGAAGGHPSVAVELAGDLTGLRPSVEAALFRLAQESVTNAVRHACRASRIRVRLEGDAGAVRLTVADDGESRPTGPDGYGLVGMAERAALLGGTFAAGPAPGGGWAVEAVLPRDGLRP